MARLAHAVTPERPVALTLTDRASWCWCRQAASSLDRGWRVLQPRQAGEVGERPLDDLVRPLLAERGRRHDEAVAEDVDGHVRIGPDVPPLVGPPVPGLEVAAARAHDERRVAVPASASASTVSRGVSTSTTTIPDGFGANPKAGASAKRSTRLRLPWGRSRR